MEETNIEKPKLQDEFRNEDGTFKKGYSGNQAGKPPGSLDFRTKWFRLIDKLAKSNNLTMDEVEEQLLAVGYKKAKEGDYRFWGDVFDRVYGKPLQKQDITSDGEKINNYIITDGTADNKQN